MDRALTGAGFDIMRAQVANVSKVSRLVSAIVVVNNECEVKSGRITALLQMVVAFQCLFVSLFAFLIVAVTCHVSQLHSNESQLGHALRCTLSPQSLSLSVHKVPLLTLMNTCSMKI